ncbi:MAG TPA: signal peptidase I [Nevskiaceae bacterium]|nr:signal peptidase I [Nevskiaceae bacterium]
MGKLKKTLSIGIGTVFAMGGALLLWVSLPQSGWKALSVQTGSMRPAIGPGALVVVHRVAVESLQPGDVITYQKTAQQTVTHRLVRVDTRPGGTVQLIVKGDANAVADQPVYASQLVGRVAYHAPWLGHAADAVRTPLGLLIMLYVPALLIVADELRRLAEYYRRQRYMLVAYRLRLKAKKEKNNHAPIAAVATFCVAVVAMVAAAAPVRAAFAGQVVLAGNTITALNPQAVDHVLIRRVTFDCSTDNTGQISRLVSIIFYNPTNRDIATGNWHVDSGSGRLVTFRPVTVFDGRDDYDIQPDLVAGVRYAGDHLTLYDNTGKIVDAISWGNDTTQLDPSLPQTQQGTDFRRVPIVQDTNTAADWQVNFRGECQQD